MRMQLPEVRAACMIYTLCSAQAMGRVAALSYNATGSTECLSLARALNATNKYFQGYIYQYQGCIEGLVGSFVYDTDGVNDMFWDSREPSHHFEIAVMSPSTVSTFSIHDTCAHPLRL